MEYRTAKETGMQTWILPCNTERKYDAFGAFEKLKKLDWHQTRQTKNIGVGDIVYIYANRQGICFKCQVTKTGIFGREIDDTEFCIDDSFESGDKEYFEVECITKFPTDKFVEYSVLRENGLTASLQGPLRINDELCDFLRNYESEGFCSEAESNTRNNKDIGVILDASKKVEYHKVFETLNQCFGTSYSGWMQACWPSVRGNGNFRVL